MKQKTEQTNRKKMEYRIKVNGWMKLFVVLLIAIAAIACEQQPVIMVGVGEAVITPPDPVGVSLAGFDRGGNLSTGVHDDLHTRSIVVEDEDGEAMALLTVALIGISEEISDLIRSRIEEQTGIPFENIVISATHTHSGPRPTDPEDDFTRFFIDRSVESAINAWEERLPGRIGIASTDIYSVGLKRDALMHGGVHPDRETAVIKVENAAGRLMGLFFNYGAHPATLDLHNLQITEDWPYFAITRIKEKIGENVVVGYIQGAEGDINTGYSALHSAVGANMYGARSWEQARWKGELMANALLELLPSIETNGNITVGGSYDHFDFPIRTTYPWTHEEALNWEREAQERLEEMEARLPGSYPTNMEETREWQREMREKAMRGELDSRTQIGLRRLDTYKVDLWAAQHVVSVSRRFEDLPENPDPIRMPMQSIRLGDAVFVTFPNEVYSEIGVAVKELSPYEKTFIIGLAGGRGGYIPTAADHLEWGYVPNGTLFAPETEQVLIDASLELIRRVDN